MNRLVTDSLGFRLEVSILIGDLPNLGQHRTYEDESGQVSPEAAHRINIQSGLLGAELGGVVAHEVYHLFFSIRHLITADEETQAETFGDLVRNIIKLA